MCLLERRGKAKNQFKEPFNRETFFKLSQEESVLQRYSFEDTFKLMENDDYSIVKELFPPKLDEFKKLVKWLVIGSDRQHHFKH